MIALTRDYDFRTDLQSPCGTGDGGQSKAKREKSRTRADPHRTAPLSNKVLICGAPGGLERVGFRRDQRHLGCRGELIQGYAMSVHPLKVWPTMIGFGFVILLAGSAQAQSI